MTWTPETNRIPFGLLTDEEKSALQACEQGWEFKCMGAKEWLYTPDPVWTIDVVYRAKPAPKKRIVVWLHYDQESGSGITRYKGEANLWVKDWGGFVKRIEMDEDGGNVVVTDEVFTDVKEVL